MTIAEIKARKAAERQRQMAYGTSYPASQDRRGQATNRTHRDGGARGKSVFWPDPSVRYVDRIVSYNELPSRVKRGNDED